MDERTTTTDTALLRHAERQTKALENINFMVMALFCLALLTGAIWLLAWAI